MSSKTKTYLKDYQAPDYRIDTVTLRFDLEPENTQVTSTMHIMRLPNTEPGARLTLAGENLKLLTITLDGELLALEQYQINDKGLTIFHLPEQCELTIVNTINPQANTDLEGLFISGGNFCTQCEPHGFRHITYFLDRPDNLSRFTTTLFADKAKFPILLSNGNCIDSGDAPEGRHFATWEDPFLKPSYLFALVAGTLDVLEDEFTTVSGRKVELKIFVDAGCADRAEHAMESLKLSMRWDEEKYGREYDLDIFMIVAVRDFNMGAMENKGLNIFNSKYILANPESATDVDFENILGIVGHEYFHNWSGNRVTCRDWFQLSLKEGFTVFRDQTFTADHTSEAVKRIDDIVSVRTYQFAEDAGPTAHAVLPEAYIEMNNFYTMTIYYKGAELIRMYHTLLGPEKYREATDLYFERHDGGAVTIEEFVKCMEEVSGRDLSQFRLWYHQAGTPKLTVTQAYDAKAKKYHLTIKQHVPDTPEQTRKKSMHIPIMVGLLNEQGEEIVANELLELTEAEQTFSFDNIASQPVPSLLRGFSAPVTLDYNYSDADLALLMAHDTDVFARYEAAQTYAIRQINALKKALEQGEAPTVGEEYLQALKQVATAKFDDKALQALLLSLPSEKYLTGLYVELDPIVLHQAHKTLRLSVAKHLELVLKALYAENIAKGDYANNAIENAKRRIKNMALSYLTLLDDGQLASEQFAQANNMTDSIAALNCLAHCENSLRDEALQAFYNKWKDEPIVLDKWLSAQSMADLPDALIKVKSILQGNVFDHKNPNSLRALIGGFASGNPSQFHAANGSGYVFLADQVMAIDKFNKQVAANLVGALLPWRNYDAKRQMLMKEQLQRIIADEALSNNTFELVEKAIK
jgi:aminopeptidase N